MDKKTADRCIQWWRDNPEEGDRILKEIRSDIGFTTQDHTIQEWYSRALRRVKKEEKVTKWHLSAETTRLMKEFHEVFSADLKELRRDFEDSSESFRDSVQGIAIGAWINNLESIGADIEDVKAPND